MVLPPVYRYLNRGTIMLLCLDGTLCPLMEYFSAGMKHFLLFKWFLRNLMQSVLTIRAFLSDGHIFLEMEIHIPAVSERMVTSTCEPNLYIPRMSLLSHLILMRQQMKMSLQKFSFLVMTPIKIYFSSHYPKRQDMVH